MCVRECFLVCGLEEGPRRELLSRTQMQKLLVLVTLAALVGRLPRQVVGNYQVNSSAKAGKHVQPNIKANLSVHCCYFEL